ncbi:MAG: 16S rRNA (cytosine(1402)-N(4))-methyltransferase [bacterium]|nr:16S rRNA (cytosine(1402)-N(4))-methyltransferase RsmH [Candidatus Microgenomates bacterium CPR3]MCQ3944560.1 16S rRNA (cytosine(1402)-N(4))-methyltransferase [bacterium]RIK51604.1 MAG: 16S rRNA (cytosine(1402)-N(4))-methyltransferase [Candidatus Microgenomates bacterium]
MENKLLHTPVLLSEVVKIMAPEPGKMYIDATLGYGGHTLELLKAGASVVGIDQDADILELAQKRITGSGLSANFTSLHSSFASALDGDRLEPSKYSGVLMDLGVSSYQLDTPERGFSFRHDAPLDMRMNKDLAVTAKDLINGLGKNELIELFSTLGEEYAAKKIVAAILDARKTKPIESTAELASLVARNVTRSKSHLHPATKVFQALRMAVNTEREELKAALPSAWSKLTSGGVLVVISFHSLEDEIVKNFFASLKDILEVSDIITPSLDEQYDNRRSRSAKLRYGRKA